MTAPIEKQVYIDFKQEFPPQQLQNLITLQLNRFQRILKLNVGFHVCFLSLILAQILYLAFHLTFLMQTFALAIHLSLVFFTIFSYFILRLYVQTKKEEKYITLKADYIQIFKEGQSEQEGLPEYHLALAAAYCKLAASLHAKEYQIYSLPSCLDILSSFVEKLSCWCHWQDVHNLKELLLQASIEEHIKLVRADPTDLEAHAGLANAYVMLSGLYVDPRTIEELDEGQWIPSNKYGEYFKRKFRAIAERAIEEFKILSDYAPQDPWVHAQLAYSYRDLQMPKEEIKEYETILQLCPEDKETLFKLGKLYFEQGFNAKGLQLYETLKRSNYKKAENLIQFYGAYSHQMKFKDN